MEIRWQMTYDTLGEIFNCLPFEHFCKYIDFFDTLFKTCEANGAILSDPMFNDDDVFYIPLSKEDDEEDDEDYFYN